MIRSSTYASQIITSYFLLRERYIQKVFQNKYVQ